MSRTLLDEIKNIILRETIWLRVYSATVLDIDDPLNEGRIKVKVLDLSWDNTGQPDSAFTDWAAPRNVNGLLTPKIGDYVDVYFRDGKKENLAYIGMGHETQSVRPSSYTSPTTQVIFESRNTPADSIIYDESVHVLKILGSAEAFVKGDTFKTQLDLIIALLSQVKTSLTTFSPTGTPADTATWNALVTVPLSALQNGTSQNILSTKIKGA